MEGMTYGVQILISPMEIIHYSSSGNLLRFIQDRKRDAIVKLTEHLLQTCKVLITWEQEEYSDKACTIKYRPERDRYYWIQIRAEITIEK